jgi:hypothetical protein
MIMTGLTPALHFNCSYKRVVFLFCFALMGFFFIDFVALKKIVHRSIMCECKLYYMNGHVRSCYEWAKLFLFCCLYIHDVWA